MGKFEQQRRFDEERQAQLQRESNSSSSEILCDQCSVLVSRISKDLSFKCLFIFLLSLSLLVYGIFSIVPFRSKKFGFDAQQAIKLSASAQAFFILEKPVTELLPHIRRLEYDINEEIGVFDTKVVILSMHGYIVPNKTAVVFGAISNTINDPISPVSLSVMRSSLIEVFMKQANLTLTKTIFGYPSKFEILKFHGGITVMPELHSIWQLPQILFNFTLNNSISEVLEIIDELKDQLKFGLRLRMYENVFVQITNVVGSTAQSPIIIQASITSEHENLSPERLRQLVEILTGSPARNLGLDHQVFGKVKSVSLSSYLRGKLSSLSPSPSPGPAPEPSASFRPSISPVSPTYQPVLAPAPDFDSPPSSQSLPPQPCPYHDIGTPSLAPSLSPLSNPAAHPVLSPHSLPMVPKPRRSPSSSPLPQVSRALSPVESKGKPQRLSSSLLSPAPSPSAASSMYKTIWSLALSALIIFYLLCCSN